MTYNHDRSVLIYFLLVYFVFQARSRMKERPGRGGRGGTISHDTIVSFKLVLTVVVVVRCVILLAQPRSPTVTG